MVDSPRGPNRTVVSVSELTGSARRLLEGEFPLVYVEGEISNFAVPRSGHWYFTLKDANAQVRSAMFRNRNMRLRFRPKDGDQVVVRGKLSLFEPRGDFQLIAEHMEVAGDGALRAAFEQLKAMLHAEGLFESERKQPVPEMPRRIAIITSPHGAAIHDVLQVMARRFPATQVLIVPVQVQGAEAPPLVAAALATIGKRSDIDAVLVTRGGGSLEDLWAFNTEIVARAIAACPLPVVSAVGHESDVTIADFVADLRAPTPSAAAELLTQDGREWQARFTQIEDRLIADWQRALMRRGQQVDYLGRRLRHPGERLALWQSRLAHLVARLHGATREKLREPDPLRAGARLHQAMKDRLSQSETRLDRAAGNLRSPANRLQLLAERLTAQQDRLTAANAARLRETGESLRRNAQALQALSPLNILARGYAIVTDDNDDIVRDAATLNTGDTIHSRVHRGRVTATVTRIDKDDS